MPLEQLIAAKDGVLRKESDAVAQRAVLKEAEPRLAQSQRCTSPDRPLLSPSERRLAAMERAVRSLRYETENIELDLPIKTSPGG